MLAIWEPLENETSEKEGGVGGSFPQAQGRWDLTVTWIDVIWKRQQAKMLSKTYLVSVHYKWSVMRTNGRTRDVTSRPAQYCQISHWNGVGLMFINCLSKFETRPTDFVWVVTLSSRAVSGENMDLLSVTVLVWFRFLFVLLLRNWNVQYSAAMLLPWFFWTTVATRCL